jgi:hypothetical protein
MNDDFVFVNFYATIYNKRLIHFRRKITAGLSELNGISHLDPLVHTICQFFAKQMDFLFSNEVVWTNDERWLFWQPTHQDDPSLPKQDQARALVCRIEFHDLDSKQTLRKPLPYHCDYMNKYEWKHFFLSLSHLPPTEKRKKQIAKMAQQRKSGVLRFTQNVVYASTQ